MKDIFPLIDVMAEIMDSFGEIKACIHKIGRAVDDIDLLIVATAIMNKMTLVTHNTRHFEHILHITLDDWY